ncbi:MAG TPA: TIGR04282 family arsenosugar biosynthesis glycosyltransferase [Nitrospiria bacterium]|nr:TIGR04282 family arsenosugar biosynthesis glycosyltransferase [Nitrospiria bacterium]
MLDALLIFAKAPEPGKTKTRLLSHLSAPFAARIQEAMTNDILRVTAQLKVNRYVLAAPSGRHPYFKEIAARFALPCLDQVGVALGERMESAFQHSFKEGFQKVVIIGTDSPTLPIALIDEGFRRLEDVPVVLGPSADGGYYLIGLRAPVPGIFDGIAWGTERVLARSLEILKAQKIDHALLPPWRDLDRPEELYPLLGEIESLRRLGKSYPEETYRLLSSLLENAVGPYQRAAVETE